ncbi:MULTISPECIES: DegT/DnrJ/EryC1/StrS aminotransferase family protein [Sorangium]|uniref:DegT/DnrJ/EryC1/StrS family aminotransferase n=1 Tax=Sorangium TaxID=39643 RepID=UPI00101A03D1|nr:MULTISPECIES: DegT/DnrJ/EryC1/StrS family aminotransferase [Sorangium]
MARSGTTNRPLALLGGKPVWTERWPVWPRHGERALARLQSVLEGGRWAVSGAWNGQRTMDQEFSERFAAYLGASHAYTVDHGSSALFAALQAVGVGFGQEVIVPGLTWVACASAALRLNAVPVLVDVSADTLCMSPAAVEAAITPSTAAILVVHLYSAMADMERLRSIADRHHLPLVEDCAQAHGAIWDGRHAGTLGDVAAFSMQQGKVMTCGEGGALVTSDPAIARRLELLRTDGRRYLAAAPPVGHPDLEERGDIQGFNLCLSEFQSALLLDALERLEEETEQRAAMADLLARRLGELRGVEPIRPHPQNTRRAYYHYAVRFEAEEFAGCSVEQICAALEAELGTWVHPPYRPLDAHPLYRPERYAGLPAALRERADPRRFPLPEAHRQASRTLLFHHSVLLGSEHHINAIAEALAKVQAGAAALRALPRGVRVES